MEVVFQLHKAKEDPTAVFLALSGFPFNVHFSRSIVKMDVKCDLCLLILKWYDNQLCCKFTMLLKAGNSCWSQKMDDIFWVNSTKYVPWWGHIDHGVCAPINSPLLMVHLTCAHTAVVVLVRHFLHTLFHCEWYALVACQFCKGDMGFWNYWWLCLTMRLCWLVFLDETHWVPLTCYYHVCTIFCSCFLWLFNTCPSMYVHNSLPCLPPNHSTSDFRTPT